MRRLTCFGSEKGKPGRDMSFIYFYICNVIGGHQPHHDIYVEQEIIQPQNSYMCWLKLYTKQKKK